MWLLERPLKPWSQSHNPLTSWPGLAPPGPAVSEAALAIHNRHMRLLTFLGLTLAAAAQGLHPPVPAPLRDFAVMAWGNSPSDPEQLRGMKEAGLNISGFCRAEDLNQVRDAGLACFVRDARANGYDWTSMPPDEVLRRNVAALKDQIGGNSAALGFFLRDEPPASLMPGMGKIAALMREAMPDKY